MGESALTSQPRQEILRVHRLRQNLEFMPLSARPVQQIGSCSLTREEQDLA
jgi:hypothetical protein